MKPVGYLINYKEGLAGEPGLFYNYILEGNGVFIRAESPLLRVSVPIADANIRGLQRLTPGVELINGKIPRYLYDQALSVLSADRYTEHYLAITWEDGYRLRDTTFEAGGASVNYENMPSTIMDIHSHGPGKAWFSYTDDRDEQGLRLSLVVGRLDTLLPDVNIRIGIYGYFYYLTIDEVFGV